MEIEIKLYASLRKYLPGENKASALMLKVPDNATVTYVLDTLQIPQKSVKLIFVNNVRASLDRLLQAGDRLGVFPPVAGG